MPHRTQRDSQMKRHTRGGLVRAGRRRSGASSLNSLWGAPLSLLGLSSFYWGVPWTCELQKPPHFLSAHSHPSWSCSTFFFFFLFAVSLIIFSHKIYFFTTPTVCWLSPLHRVKFLEEQECCLYLKILSTKPRNMVLTFTRWPVLPQEVLRSIYSC